MFFLCIPNVCERVHTCKRMFTCARSIVGSSGQRAMIEPDNTHNCCSASTDGVSTVESNNKAGDGDEHQKLPHLFDVADSRTHTRTRTQTRTHRQHQRESSTRRTTTTNKFQCTHAPPRFFASVCGSLYTTTMRTLRVYMCIFVFPCIFTWFTYKCVQMRPLLP